MSLEVEDFYFAIEISNEGYREDFKDQMMVESFGAWQVVETIKALMQGKDKKGSTFEDYIKSLGLLDKTEKKKEFKEKEKALKNAQKIVELHKRGAKVKND